MLVLLLDSSLKHLTLLDFLLNKNVSFPKSYKKMNSPRHHPTTPCQYNPLHLELMCMLIKE